jgi:hypothetical protein
MTEKKRPNKRAKAVAKLLKDSELLAATKATNESKADPNLKPTDIPNKTVAPKKTRPEKKRG